METLIIYLIKSSGLLILFYLGYYFLLRKETFFTTNRWFLLSGLLTALVLPLIVYTKVVLVEQTSPIVDWSRIPITTNTGNDSLEINWFLIFGIIYCIGTLVFMTKFFFDFYSLSRILKGKSIQLQADFKLIDTNENLAPFSYFNTVVYNSNLYTAAELENILEHEKVHCEQNHTADVIISRVFCILFWFNPLIWLYKKAILQNLEFIADHEATKKITDKKAYQITLLKITTHENCVAISNHFYQSLIKKRIVMLNKNQSNKRSSWKYAAVIPALIAFVFLFQIKVVAQEKESTPIEKKLIKGQSTEIIVTKNTTDEELKKYCDELEKTHDIDLTFFNIKRNDKGEITKIESKYKDKDTGGGSAIANESDNKPIKPFKFFYNESKKENGYNMDLKPFSENKQILNIEKNITNPNKDKVVKPNNTVTQLDDKIVVQGISNQDGTKPLIIINGKKQKANFDLKLLDPNTIAAINVLKNEKATEKYGKEGINGVIEITAKDKNVELTAPTTTSKSGKSFSFTQIKSSTDSLNGKGSFKRKTDVRDLNLEKIDPNNLNNKQFSKKTSKIEYLKVTSDKNTIDEAEIYIDGVKSTKAVLDKISPSAIDKMEVNKSDNDKKTIKITTKKQ